jgi:hypothetical protein
VIIEFLHDDGGYLAWLRDHPNGYVLNCEPNPKPSYLMLHRATCGTITGAPSSGGSWTVAYQKVCSDSHGELDRWAAQVGPLTPCGICQPS